MEIIHNLVRKIGYYKIYTFHTDAAMSEPNKKDSRKVSIILPPDGDHGNEEEETIGAHCSILNLESDTTSNRRRQS